VIKQNTQTKVPGERTSAVELPTTSITHTQQGPPFGEYNGDYGNYH